MSGDSLYLMRAATTQPVDLVQSAWHEHAPFAFYLMAALKPALFVELGAHNGFSYFCFCQARAEHALATRCYAVDTWNGDEHAGFYGEDVFLEVSKRNTKYSAFSTLVRSRFDAAAERFEDHSIDLIHFDGRHFYDDVKADFEAYEKKLSPDAIVIFHDTNVHERDFGVWKYFREIKANRRAFEFLHGHGLGVVAMGNIPQALRPFFDADSSELEHLRSYYAKLGAVIGQSWNALELQTALQTAEKNLSIAGAEAAEAAHAAAAMAVEIKELRRQADDALRDADEGAREVSALRDTVVALGNRLEEGIGAAKAARDEADILRDRLAATGMELAKALADAESARRTAEGSDRATQERETALSATIAEQQATIAAVERRLEETRAEHRQIDIDRRALRIDNEGMRGELHHILGSTSWKITQPLRNLTTRYPRVRSLARRLIPRGKRSANASEPAPAPPPPPAIPAPVSDIQRYVRLPLPSPPSPQPSLRLGVMLHCYYLDVLPRLVDALANIPIPFHVIVTTDDDEKKAGILSEVRRLPLATVDIVMTPNRGRDVAPRLVALRERYRDFDLVLHLHTKKSVHTPELSGWLPRILDDLLGSRQVVESVFELFAGAPRLGIVAPRYFEKIRPYISWGENFIRCASEARWLGIRIDDSTPVHFPAGSMFWARPPALQPLFDAEYRFEDFEPESGQRDGTLAHALERLAFFSSECVGYGWCYVGHGSPQGPFEEASVASSFVSISGIVGQSSSRLLAVPDRDAKAKFRDRCAIRLAVFLDSDRRIVLPTSPTPEVSIIVVLFNGAELTFEHLLSLRRALDVPSEVIIVDNASTDLTSELLARVDGAVVFRNKENLHFLRGVNRAAEAAKGELLLMLNNDTRIPAGAIRRAAARLRADPTIGAVGAKIILLDGSLQEAGSIVFNDGSCLGYGRGRQPDSPEFCFPRDVDFCSGAFLMTPRRLFEALGGFDEAFAPAYYEETDLSMRLRAAGYRTVYDPDIEISHFEFGSSASSKDAIALQARNAAIFRRKHGDALSRYHYAFGAPRALSRDAGAAGRILIIDDTVPFPSLGTGYPRAAKLLAEVREAGWNVTFYPLPMPNADLTAAREAFPEGIEFAIGHGPDGLAAFLRDRTGCFDIAFVSRPHNMETFKRALAEAPGFLRSCRLVYDAEAFFAEREALRRALRGQPFSPAEHRSVIEKELALADGASLIMTVSARERDLFEKGLAGKSASPPQVLTLGHMLEMTPAETDFDARRDILFVGALNGASETVPNVDSLVWFVNEIMPILDESIGRDWRLLAAGRSNSPEIARLASDRVRILGLVPDLSDHYASARLFIAPTRFAAGVPLKVYEAAAHGLPAVVTPLLADQLGWRDGKHMLVGDTPRRFAEQCARLYSDRAVWTSVRNGGLKKLERDCSPEAFRKTVSEMLADSSDSDEVRRRRRERRAVELAAVAAEREISTSGSFAVTNKLN